MFDFECHCVYVEFTNDRVPHAGRIEYRARECDVCRCCSDLAQSEGKPTMAFGADAPRYQRLH